MIQNRTTKINPNFVSLYLSASYVTFYLSTTLTVLLLFADFMFFGRSDGGEDYRTHPDQVKSSY
jgi:hypothetical protein